MKTKLILGLFLFMIFVESKAQQFHGGAMVGLVASTVTGDSYGGWNKAGLFAGGYVNLEFGRRSAFQMELEYIQKGSRKNPDHSKNDYDSYLLRLGYMELPVLYQFKIKDWLSIETGPSIGFLFHYYEEVNEQEEQYPDLCKVTYSWNIGLNFIITDRILINFRSNNSLVNIRNSTKSGDVSRFWAYGEYNDIFILSVFCRLTKLGKDRSEK